MRSEAQVCPHRVPDHSIASNEVRDPGGVEPEGDEGFPGSRYLPPGIDQEPEGKLMVLAEAGVLLGFFRVDPDDLQPGFLDACVAVAHPAGLASAHGGEIPVSYTHLTLPTNREV